VGKVQGAPSEGTPEFQGKFLKNNFSVTVKLRVLRHLLLIYLHCFIATPQFLFKYAIVLVLSSLCSHTW